MGASGAELGGPLEAVLAELRAFESAQAPLDQWFERGALAITGILLVAKVALTIVHSLAPFDGGVSTIMVLATAIVATGVVGQVPTLVRLAMEGMFPDRTHASRRRDLAIQAAAIDRLRRQPQEHLLMASRLISSRGDGVSRRVSFLIGPLSNLGMVPAIVMLLTAFGRLSTSMDQQAMALDAVHYAMVLAFVLYFAAALSESLTRRVATYRELLETAADAGRQED
ncbi:MAG: hypothetical protein R3200_11035 [Xanthomonadales bacterium]|nr:hypothetical protein [Xanthomonadales bacterium]